MWLANLARGERGKKKKTGAAIDASLGRLCSLVPLGLRRYLLGMRASIFTGAKRALGILPGWSRQASQQIRRTGYDGRIMGFGKNERATGRHKTDTATTRMKVWQ